MFRFVLYGRPGCGKSVTLSHLTHYGHSAGFITMTFSQIKKWLTRYYTTAPSTFSPGQVDHIMNSNIFLKNFRQANLERLSDPRLVTHKVSFPLRDLELELSTECVHARLTPGVSERRRRPALLSWTSSTWAVRDSPSLRTPSMLSSGS